MKQVCGSWHGIRPWGVLPVLEGCGGGSSLRMLLLGIVKAGGGRAFFFMEFCCRIGDFLELPWAKLYTVTGMDVAAAFATGIWVVTVEVVTVGVGSAGRMQFMGKVGLVGIGWAIILTLNLLFTSALAFLFLSVFLGVGVFLGEILC